LRSERRIFLVARISNSVGDDVTLAAPDLTERLPDIAGADNGNFHQSVSATSPSARFPKFVIQGGTLAYELRKKGTSKLMFLVPLIDLRSLNPCAATDVGTSNRRH